MTRKQEPYCPECVGEQPDLPEVDRRGFMQLVGVGAAAVAGVGGLLGKSIAAPATKTPAKPATPRPAEGLIKELYANLSAEQKTKLVVPYDHGANKGRGRPTRLGIYNGPMLGQRIGNSYTKGQQELIERILRSICADEDGYRRISRNGGFDSSGSIRGCGAVLFGEPKDGQDWCWMLSGHHLTIRCDGRTTDGIGFGGPLYYGHSPNGYNVRNVFYYQTKSVLSVFDALSAKQRKAAVIIGSPGENLPSIKFREAGQSRPGLPFTELTADQKLLVEKVMKDVLSPYRKEDVEEVMGIVKATGGMEKIHLAFYQQKEGKDDKHWHFWRLEGPGFIWNYRVLPHVHTYVNVARKA